MKKKKVFVGMSGGVDSAVSAALLKQKGYEVIGVFIRTWHPDFLVCNEEQERHDAMRAAAHLDIPFLTFDFEDVYKKEVGDYIISEYKNGRTPNGDVMCNKAVKFGAFLNKALSMGADFVATGHYAQNIFKDKKFLLKKGIDPAKDQSYFLWTLNQNQLSKILFPVGNLKKTEVRILAKNFKLPVADKKDSQGICFLGAVDLKDFLKHYIKEKKGNVINEQGENIGNHDGVFFYTLGERHGFTIIKKGSNDLPYYIIDKDIKKNILVVSQKNNSSNLKNKKDKNCLNLNNVNWISGVLEQSKTLTAQIRYHGDFLQCTVEVVNQNEVKVHFINPVLVDAGQSCVVYDKDITILGGIIV